MNIFLFICSLFIPLIILGGGFFMQQHAPEKINSLVGYRTARSMKNLDTWKFAHAYCGRLWLRLGAIMLVVTLAVCLLVLALPNTSGSDLFAVTTLVLVSAQTVLIVLSIIPTEKALKRTFDENGHRR